MIAPEPAPASRNQPRARYGAGQPPPPHQRGDHPPRLTRHSQVNGEGPARAPRLGPWSPAPECQPDQKQPDAARTPRRSRTRGRRPGGSSRRPCRLKAPGPRYTPSRTRVIWPAIAADDSGTAVTSALSHGVPALPGLVVSAHGHEQSLAVHLIDEDTVDVHDQIAWQERRYPADVGDLIT